MIQPFDKLYNVYKACVNYHCNDGLIKTKTKLTCIYMIEYKTKWKTEYAYVYIMERQKRNETEHTQEHIMECEMQ